MGPIVNRPALQGFLTRKLPARLGCYTSIVSKPNTSDIMMRILCSVLLALASFAAYAQSSVAEPPTEHASMLTVVVFIVFFVVACVGYVAYAWWSGKKEKERGGS